MWFQGDFHTDGSKNYLDSNQFEFKTIAHFLNEIEKFYYMVDTRIILAESWLIVLVEAKEIKGDEVAYSVD